MSFVRKTANLTPIVDTVFKIVELAKKDGFVAISKIVKVGENESVVDLPAGKTVKVGDVVLYKSAAK